MNISERARWVECLLGSTRGHGRQARRPRNKQQYLRCKRWRCPRCRAARQHREEQGDCSFFFSLCSPCSVRKWNSILPYAPNHLAFSPQRFPTATTLPRQSTPVRYIYLHSYSIYHILLDISDALTPSNPSYPCSIHSTTDDNEATAASGKKPPPRSTGQEATAAQHRARSHRRAAPGKKPPPRRIGQEATAAPHRARSHRRAASGKKPPPRRKPPQRRRRLAASDPRTHDFPVHPSYLPSTHKFEFQLFVSTIRLACG